MMKILRIRFRNLNSLAGDWTIDLTHPAYTTDGIFAITGPTGAGKSTVLDAICLALYGQTPRLGKVTKSANEIMARHTGDAFAEVTFQTEHGTFRCMWSQRRARNRPAGELQMPKHELASADTGTTITSKLSEVPGEVAVRTGMDFDRFTRSMLLAQGGFAAFLQAAPSERSPILEQITGTEIYSGISIEVHKRWKGETDKLAALDNELKGIELLSPVEEQELRQSLAEQQEQTGALDATTRRARAAVAWLAQLAQLEQELATLAERKRAWEQQWRAAQPGRDRLTAALNALAIDAAYASASGLRAAQRQDEQDRHRLNLNIPQFEEGVKTKEQAQLQAELRLNTALAAQQQQLEVIKDVRAVDVQLRELRAQQARKDKHLKELRAQCDEWRNKDRAAAQTQLTLREQLNRASRYIELHTRDSGLAEREGLIANLFKALRDTNIAAAKAQTARDAAQTQSNAAEAAYRKRQTDRANTVAKLQELEQNLWRARENHQRALDGREPAVWRALLTETADRRGLLKDALASAARRSVQNQQRDSLHLRKNALGPEIVRLAADAAALTAQQNAAESNIELLQKQKELESRIKDLEVERNQLRDGLPCPLCGAIEHPYAAGNIPPIGDAERKLDHTKRQLKQLNLRSRKLADELSDRRNELKIVEQQLLQVEATAAGEQQQLNLLLQRLHLAPESDQLITALEREAAAETNRGADISRQLAAIDAAAQLERDATTKFDQGRTAFSMADNLFLEAKQHRDSAERDAQRLADEASEVARKVQDAQADAQREVLPFGIVELPVDRLDDIRHALTERRKRYVNAQDDIAKLEKQIDGAARERDKAAIQIDGLEQRLSAAQQEALEVLNSLTLQENRRSGLFGARDPDEEERNLARSVDQARRHLDAAKQAVNHAATALAEQRTRLDSLAQTTAARAPSLAAAEEALAGYIHRAGFSSEADYRAACLADAERERLRLVNEQLERRKTELETQIADRQRSLDNERAKAITEQPQGEAQAELESLEAQLRDAQQKIGADKRRLMANEELRARQQDRLRERAGQRRTVEVWGRLEDLIGSYDGKKYRNFAQGLTFEILVVHANRQLQHLTDRYLLTRDKDDPLELNVIDSYQAGEVRSIKNLSGGESFLVSLALSLGLSHMSSRTVRIDSLFLDEGFGSLDDDALSTALETLASLRHDGKLIGVISHVPALKERISAQIQVVPLTGGRSKLLGPGCHGGMDRQVSV